MAKIGIDFSVQKKSGGAYQYCLSFLDVLMEDDGNEYVVFNSSGERLPKKYLGKYKIVNAFENKKKENIIITNIMEYGYRLLLFLRLSIFVDFLFRLRYHSILKKIKKENLDLIIFPSQERYVAYVDVPRITTIYDLEHRKHPEFPEVSSKGRWASREFFFKKICKRSKKIFVDSDIGKEDVVHFYKCNSNDVIVLPYLPPNYLEENIKEEESLEILKKFNLPSKFLFYPAQFWPHKNHMNLLTAIKLLRDGGTIVSIVLCGSKKKEWGEYDRVLKYIKDNQLDRQVFVLGYVENNEMSALYKSCQAMVMPTFFGPTNIPVLEAWKMECPVLYSNIRGCREQLGDAGLLIDPRDPSNIAENIKRIWIDSDLRNDLIMKGKHRLNLWTYEDFYAKIKHTTNIVIDEI